MFAVRENDIMPGAFTASKQHDDEDSGSERRCIVTRVSHPPADLMRFVRAPDGSVIADLKGNLPGRGAWITPQKSMLVQAIKKNLFGKALKAEVKVSPSLADEVEDLLRLRARESLSLANKAGLVVFGFTRVDAAIREGLVIGLIEASDGAQSGRQKLESQVNYAETELKKPVQRFFSFDSTDLGLALGRSHVIHAALIEGPAARASLARLGLLDHYRAGETADLTHFDPRLTVHH